MTTRVRDAGDPLGYTGELHKRKKITDWKRGVTQGKERALV